jgi:hypothetical protein
MGEDRTVKAYNEGHLACMEGLSPRANPYDDGTVEQRQWDDGYEAAAAVWLQEEDE